MVLLLKFPIIPTRKMFSLLKRLLLGRFINTKYITPTEYCICLNGCIHSFQILPSNTSHIVCADLTSRLHHSSQRSVKPGCLKNCVNASMMLLQQNNLSGYNQVVPSLLLGVLRHMVCAYASDRD